MKKLLFLCTCLAFTFIMDAQTEDRKWNIGISGGATQYNGDLGNDFYKTDMTFYGVGGFSVSRYLGKYFDLNLAANKGTVAYNRADGYFNSEFSSIALNLKINLLNPDYVVRPYVFGGLGVMLFDKKLDVDSKKIDYLLPTAGGGLTFRLSPVVMLNVQETFMFTDGDDRDGVSGGSKDSFLMHTVGLSFNLGEKKDADNDGVSDRNDKCSDTPAGIAVDKNGCPLDKDNDGVADYLDECPEVAGSPALNGCPDRDKDGVADAKDRCPDVAGPVALRGCPDVDNDGVADIDDKCPNTPAGQKVDAAGCPMDNDKDGVVNSEDRCPDAAGPVSLKGCPDTDGDGVPDIDDRCPTVKGNIINKGCPEIAPKDVKKIAAIAGKLFFENASAKLKTSSYVQLNDLVIILNRYDATNLQIEGHTDSNGSDAYNIKLSQERMESVKQYLTSKGIAESRLLALGFGEGKPIATNKTAAGRAKNRRVELKTTY
jgi:OOP family OmpA-OmpF porin